MIRFCVIFGPCEGHFGRRFQTDGTFDAKTAICKKHCKTHCFSLFFCSEGVAFHVFGSIFATLGVDLFQVGVLGQILGPLGGRFCNHFCKIGGCFLDVFFDVFFWRPLRPKKGHELHRRYPTRLNWGGPGPPLLGSKNLRNKYLRYYGIKRRSMLEI